MLLSNLDQMINSSIESGLDSAQVLIVKNHKIIKHSAYGDANLSTLYDIASLTKVFSLTVLYQVYATQGKINLNLTLKEIFPHYFEDQSLADKANITIKMLLAHEAGFEPNPLFYDKNYNTELFCQNRDEFLGKLLKAPLIHIPQSCSLYSDVDFMLLTFILEHLLQTKIDVLFQATFPELHNQRVCYQPLQHGYSKSEIAPTELHGNTRDGFIHFDNIRTETIHGEVQDEKAYHCMNGISGHAGLFANCEALYSALQLMNIPPEFLQSQSDDPSFGLGWRLNKGGDMAYHFGHYASEEAYGHTGWTGCVVVIDPKYDLKIIYLTNRKHSKVLNPARNQHRFLGDVLWAGQYKNIMNEIYRSLGLNQ
ncbi:serine hydrolase [Wohlfahrtiimonas populi]|uniref:serine hydrolase n=1 Tax=Wohlfahrtiimonas populi TaxID=1940240 RepID=UPI001E28DE71|nr:serine hydrolase [Wohlfahrtiimonas populi]